MTSLSSPLFQSFLFILGTWVLIGIAGKGTFNDLLERLSYAFESTFGILAESINAYANRLTRYFDATEIEIAQRINKNSDWGNIAKDVSAKSIEEIDKPILANRIKIEKMTGAILGFMALIAAIYGNILLGIANFSLISPQFTIPALLDIPIAYQLMIIVGGVGISNGLYVSDILGTSNYTNALRFKLDNGQRNPLEKVMLGIRVFNIIVTLIVFLLMSANNAVISNFGYSILVLPVLITVFTAFDSLSGIYLVLSLPLYMIAFSNLIMRSILLFSIGILKAYVNVLWIIFDNTVGIFRNRK